MKRITFDDSAGMTLMELGIALMVERDDTTSLLAMANEFETHWRTPVAPEAILPCYRRMIERHWLEPHPSDANRLLVTLLGRAVSYSAFCAFVHLFDPSGRYIKAGIVYGMTTRPDMGDDDDD